jgi:hypothetical protein
MLARDTCIISKRRKWRKRQAMFLVATGDD